MTERQLELYIEKMGVRKKRYYEVEQGGETEYIPLDDWRPEGK